MAFRCIGLRSSVLFLTVVLVVLLGTPGPAAPLVRSMWDGPWHPTIPEVQTEAFLDVWTPRLLDRAFMIPYLEADEIPAHVLAEGYHALDGHTRAYLIHRLFERLSTAVPSLGEQVASLGVRHPTIERQKDLLYLFIFEKQWVRGLRAKAQEIPAEQAAGRQSFEITSDLEAKIDALKVLTPVPTVPAPAEPAALPAAESVPAPDRAGVVPDVPAVPGERRNSSQASPLGLGTYQVCTASPTKARSCSGDVPVGVAHDADVNGDGAPDVRATLSLGVPEINAVSFSLLVVRLSTAGSLPGYVTFSQDVFLAMKRVEIGFESLSTLANSSMMNVRLNDLAAAAAGVLSVTSGISYVSPGTNGGLRFRMADLNFANVLAPQESSPVQGRAVFSPVVNQTVDLNISRLATEEYRVRYRAAGATALTGDSFVDIFSGPTASATLTRRIEPTITSLPTDVTVRYAKAPTGEVTVEYNANAVIPSASVTDTSFPSATSSRIVTATASGVPTSMRVTYTPQPVRVAYQASSSMTSITASLREFSGATLVKEFTATLSSVPTSITADFAKTATGFMFASTASAPGGPLTVNGMIFDGADRVLGQATINPMPASVSVTHNGKNISYTASNNFTLTAYAEWGNAAAAAAAPNPPSVLGLSLRDGASGANTGYKARASIQGFPTAFTTDLDNRTFSVTNFRPPPAANSLTADIDLDNVVSPRLRILATQTGVPSPVNFAFGPLNTESVVGGKRTSFRYTATAPMGLLIVDIERGSDVGRLTVSNIPTSIDATVTVLNGTSSARILLGGTINNITASFRRTSDVSFQASTSLSQIPTDIDLQFGRVTFSSGSDSFTVPGLRYRASASTLDVTAFLNATLFGGDAQAFVTLGITNLGATADGFLQGATLRLVSTPATSDLEIHTWGRINYFRSVSGCEPSCGAFAHIHYNAHGGVVPLVVNNLGLRLTGFSNVNLRLGITSGIDGTYGTFQFGWSSISISIDMGANVFACLNPGIEFCATIVNIEVHTTLGSILFHLGTNHLALWYHIATPVPCGFFVAYDIHIDLRPHPHFTSLNGFTVSAASAEGSPAAWTVTPNPAGVVPSLAVEVVAALTSPYGGGFAITAPCH